MKSLIIASIAALMMVGCSDRFRYPCQDPDNWEKQECKKPWCSADGTCPEDLTHYEKKLPPGTQVVPVQNNNNACCCNQKGACK
jgi:hypothetical protein